MTEENYNYRTSQIMLRNQFLGSGKWKIPIISKFREKTGDFDDLLLIGFDKVSADDQKHPDRMVHFFSMITNLNVCGKSRRQCWTGFIHTARYYLLISVCIWKWHRFYSCTMCSETAGEVRIGRHRVCVLSRQSIGAMRRHSTSALKELKKEALLPYRPTWHRHTTTAAIKKNGFWQATGKCCGGLSRRKLSAIIRRFRKWKATSSMSITSAARGGI